MRTMKSFRTTLTAILSIQVLYGHPLEDKLLESLITGIREAEACAVWLSAGEIEHSEDKELVVTDLHCVDRSLADEFVTFLKSAKLANMPFRAADGPAFMIIVQDAEDNVIGLLHREQFGENRFHVLFGKMKNHRVRISGRWGMYRAISTKRGESEQPTGVELPGFGNSDLRAYISKLLFRKPNR